MKKIPRVDLHKISDELKDLRLNTESSTIQNSNSNGMQMSESIQSNI